MDYEGTFRQQMKTKDEIEVEIPKIQIAQKAKVGIHFLECI